MTVLLGAAVALAGCGAWTDHRTGQIPNWLTGTGILLGLVGHGVIGWRAGGWNLALGEVGFAFAGLIFCGLTPWVMFHKGVMGGGDVKLFAMIGALCQPMIGIEAEMYAFVIAAVIAPAKLAYEGKLIGVLGNTVSLALNPLRSKEKQRPVPREMLSWFRLGPSIFVGTVLVFVLHGGSVLAS